MCWGVSDAPGVGLAAAKAKAKAKAVAQPRDGDGWRPTSIRLLGKEKVAGLLLFYWQKPNFVVIFHAIDIGVVFRSCLMLFQHITIML